MKIRILGAHNCESLSHRMTTFLIDDVLAFEASALSSTLSPEAQQKLQAIFLTHQHYDHVRDIPAIGMSFYLNKKTIPVYASKRVLEILSNNFLNGEVYPAFFKRPEGKPTLQFHEVTPYEPNDVGGYRVVAIPVHHSVPATGFLITSGEGKTVFYTGDTGKNLTEAWHRVKPDLLVIEVTAPDRFQDSVNSNNHLTPGVLYDELAEFRKIHGYLPQVLPVHMNPYLEDEIRREIEVMSRSLDVNIQFASEGMELTF